MQTQFLQQENGHCALSEEAVPVEKRSKRRLYFLPGVKIFISATLLPEPSSAWVEKKRT